MNRVFKTKWSVAHQEYVVTDEKHTTKTKSTKSAVALAVAAMMFAAGTASASFVDTSFVADNPFVFQQAKKSFETAEYQKNWGLSAMKASSAYALGYHGQGVKVGMMDSGFLTTHQELSGDRWHTVKAEGNYSQSGERYPQYAYGSKPKDPVKYNKGDKFSVDGAYNPDFNDNHGTGCAGVYAGNRDGVGMHGVAWGSEFYSANTGGTDDTNYGPFPDYNFFKAGNNVYGSYSGTSMAAPFISGAFGVLASRYQDMSAVQVREVLLTTANHKNADGSDMIGWANADGKTTVAGGTLLAFSESIGTDHTVTVGDKGTFGVLSAYNDTFTQKGLLNSQNKDEDKLNIVIKDGGTLYIDGASDVKVQGVTFEGAKNVKFGLAGADHNKLIQVYNGEGSSVAGSFASDSALALEQSDLKKGEDFVDSLFFTVDSATLSTDKKKIEVSMKRDEGVTFQSFANGANQNSIASAIAASGNTLMGELLAASDKSQLEYVYSTLDDDFYVTARNALVTNATQVTRAVIDQASGMGEGRRAEFDEGRAHVWATGMGRWGEADGNAHSLDVDFTVGMVGAEFNVCQATKLGAFFGYGDTDYSGAQGKIDGEDKHFGIYGLTDIGNISMTYGIAYTDEDRDTTRHLGGVATSHSENASVLQGFVEGAYNFDLGVAKVSPYVGFTWARVETDDVVDGALDHNFKTEGVKDDIQIATIGARTSMPFTMGTMPVAVKADLGYSHFFGDSDGVARVQMGEGGQFATIEGSDLKGQVNFGLGIVGKVAKHATVGVSYTGAWGSDVDSHGIMGNLRINF